MTGYLANWASAAVVILKQHSDYSSRYWLRFASAASQARWSRNSDALRELIGMKTAPAMAWSYLYFLDNKGLLEHGGNCSGSWLTEKGEEVLDALNRYSAASIVDCECDEEEDEVLGAKVIDD